MAYEAKPGDMSVFRNDRKLKDNHPDYNGSFVADRDIKSGETVRFALWRKPNVLSGKLDKPMAASPKPRPVDRDDWGGPEIPF